MLDRAADRLSTFPRQAPEHAIYGPDVPFKVVFARPLDCSEGRAKPGLQGWNPVCRGCPLSPGIDSFSYPLGMSVSTEINPTLPGANLIQSGLVDLSKGRETPEALLVSIGATRLQSLGIELSAPIAFPEHKLYLHLASEKGDAAHSAYNALVRQLVSFERAACVS